MNWLTLTQFSTACDSFGIKTPQAITRGLQLSEAADAFRASGKPKLLDMAPRQFEAHLRDAVLREASTGRTLSSSALVAGTQTVEAALMDEVLVAVVPELDRVVSDLQRKFAKLAAPLEQAAQRHGITYATTSDDVIRMDDAAAIDVWRRMPEAWAAIAPVAEFRMLISSTFEERHLRSEMRMLRAGRTTRGAELLNASVLFAAADNWSADGDFYIEEEAVGQLNWLQIAQGGLRLNTPSEVRAKIAERRGAAIAAR